MEQERYEEYMEYQNTRELLDKVFKVDTSVLTEIEKQELIKHIKGINNAT